jgi:hypothetical protein
MDDRERQARGQRAARELEEVEWAFDEVRGAIMQALVETSPNNPEKVLTLHRAAQTVDAVRKALRNVIDDGLLAASAISQAGLTRLDH